MRRNWRMEFLPWWALRRGAGGEGKLRTAGMTERRPHSSKDWQSRPTPRSVSRRYLPGHRTRTTECRDRRQRYREA